jgi:hypothetical protein
MPKQQFELDDYEHAIYSERRFFTRREHESTKDLEVRAQIFLDDIIDMHPDARMIKPKNGKNVLIVWEAKI